MPLPVPVGITSVGSAGGSVRVLPTMLVFEMMEAEISGASETGHTVVVRATVWVTTAVVFWDSGRVAMSDSLAGQSVTVGAQLVMVATSVVITVMVVSVSPGRVVLSRRKCQWRGWKGLASATTAIMPRAAIVPFILKVENPVRCCVGWGWSWEVCLGKSSYLCSPGVVKERKSIPQKLADTVAKKERRSKPRAQDIALRSGWFW